MPLNPKLLTAATRRRAGHRSAWAGNRNGLPTKSISGLGVRNHGAGGSVACSSASTTLSRLAMPAAIVVCPMEPFTEPSTHRPARRGSRPNTWCNALTSIGSPNVVPVPCAST